jgi:hypothetical protein
MSPTLWLAWCALTWLEVIPKAAADLCSIEPISIPWTNVSLADGVAVNRGISIQLGGEPVALRATTIFNNCRIRNARDCEFGNATSQSGCQGASGSSFDIAKSTTWESAPEGGWNVSVIDPHEADETVIDGYDVAKFYGIPEIYGFPFEVWSNAQSDNKSGLALGPNSSFIQNLLDVQAAPSGLFGLFFGSRSQTRGVDGNLTIGGYDKARVGGAWTNLTTQAGYINDSCPLQVLVKDIRLNNIHGSFSLIADSEATVAACVDPLQNQFTFTQTMYDLFANLTDHPVNPAEAGGSNFTQQTYPLENEPLIGNLAVELADGYTTTIPHYEFVSQERGTDTEGKYAVVNASRIMVAAGTTSGAGGGVVLGGVYLSQNYLLVDYANQMFHLAPAVIGKLGDQDHDIIKVCGAATFDETDHASGSGSAKSTTGAIVGGVLGGLIAVVAALGLISYLRRRGEGRRLPTGGRPGADAPGVGGILGLVASNQWTSDVFMNERDFRNCSVWWLLAIIAPVLRF